MTVKDWIDIYEKNIKLDNGIHPALGAGGTQTQSPDVPRQQIRNLTLWGFCFVN